MIAIMLGASIYLSLSLPLVLLFLVSPHICIFITTTYIGGSSVTVLFDCGWRSILSPVVHNIMREFIHRA